MRSIFTLVTILFLNGCANLPQWSVFSISDSEIEQALDEQLVQLQKKAYLAGIPLMLSVDDLTVDIGPNGRDVVSLGTQATATISAFGFNYPMKVSLLIEGTPYYDSEKKAIFVRSLSLLDSTIDAGGYRGNIEPVSGEMMMLVNGYLASNPVYILDTSNDVIGLLSSVPLSLDVEQGQLVLRPKR